MRILNFKLKNGMARICLWSSVLSLMFSFEEQVLSWQSLGKKNNCTLYTIFSPPSGNIMSVVNYKAKYKATDLLKFDDPHSFYETQTAKKVVVFFLFILAQWTVLCGHRLGDNCIYVLCLTNLKDKVR